MDEKVNMSVPQNQSGSYISSLVVGDYFLPPDDFESFLLLDYERGGIGLNDTLEGLDYQNWTLRYFPATEEFVIEAPNTPPTVIHTAPSVSEISLAFDQNMNPFIAYVEDGDGKFFWFDTVEQQDVVSDLPAGSLTPRCCIDDKRDFASGAQISDIILCYVHNGALKKRMERDRYTIEYVLQDPFLHPDFELPAVLKRVGMNKKNRLQWLCDLANPIDWCGYVNYGN
jgi:hypothetical protein